MHIPSMEAVTIKSAGLLFEITFAEDKSARLLGEKFSSWSLFKLSDQSSLVLKSDILGGKLKIIRSIFFDVRKPNKMTHHTQSYRSGIELLQGWFQYCYVIYCRK